MTETKTCKVLTAFSVLILTLAATACDLLEPNQEYLPMPSHELKDSVDTAKKQCQTVLSVSYTLGARRQSLIDALTAEGFFAKAERISEDRSLIILHNPKYDATCALKKEI